MVRSVFGTALAPAPAAANRRFDNCERGTAVVEILNVGGGTFAPALGL